MEDGEMWVSSEGKYLRAPMREDGTSYRYLER
jgi:hypothetical protein